MNTSTVHKPGALLLEPTNKAILELGQGTAGHSRNSTVWSGPSSPEQPPNEVGDKYDREMKGKSVVWYVILLFSLTLCQLLCIDKFRNNYGS